MTQVDCISNPSPSPDEPVDWERAITAYTTPLPGSVPYENRRPVRVPGRFDRWEALDFVTAHCPFLGQEGWRRVIKEQSLLLRGRPVGAAQTLRAGEVLVHLLPDTVEPDVNCEVKVLYEDDDLFAIDKPAPLPVHPSGRFNKNSLISILHGANPAVRLWLVHRLDKDTTGCLILAKAGGAGNGLRLQFARGEVRKTYVARVFPAPSWTTRRATCAIDKAPSRAGSRRVVSGGRIASTDFEVEQKFADGTAVVVARPDTGRTHQIRLHLESLGCPVLGDALYGPRCGRGAFEALRSGLGAVDAMQSLCLHALALEFRHPRSDKPLRLFSERPHWAVDAPKP